MRTADGPASDDLVLLGDQVVEGEGQVGEGTADLSDKGGKALEVGRAGEMGEVAEDGGGQELVGEQEMAFVLHLFAKAADQGFVDCGHRLPPLAPAISRLAVP